MARRVDSELIKKKQASVITSRDTRSFQRHKISDTYDKHGSILSDVRDGTDKHLARYDVDSLEEYYPIGEGANIDDTVPLGNIQALTGALDPVLQPPLGEVYEVYGIRMLCSAFAVNREADVVIFDGADIVPLWASGAGAILALSDYLIWPVDHSTLITGAVAVIGVPPLKLTNGQYLQLDTTGIAPGETIDLYIHYIRKKIGGLRV